MVILEKMEEKMGDNDEKKLELERKKIICLLRFGSWQIKIGNLNIAEEKII